MSGKEYDGKRDFSTTPEPSGGKAPLDEPFFVIQEHAASSHHFDFRVSIGGALASWAVPKGPSTDPREKRLAVRTEDHPLAYADFEGVIPKGEYGGGRVIVWDRGPVGNVSEKNGEKLALKDALQAGHVSVRLHGEKLTGVYDLVQTGFRGNEDAWLLVKRDDDGADARRNPTSTQPESVLSGRTVDDLKPSLTKSP